ncbi:MAG: hypothetical protein E7551_02610 [Ruminococcaceae bacterium]|nr:hypothetical protein [Oscillospiraceae bacterium]
MKKLISLILLICMIFSLVGCGKNENSSSDFEYTVTYDKNLEMGVTYTEICITKYIGEGNEVVIPEEIDGLPVTSIGVSAFWSTKIQSVTIPASVTKIENMAFYNCENLKIARFLGNAPYSVKIDAFQYTHKDFKIYYKKGTEGWNGASKAPIADRYPMEAY